MNHHQQYEGKIVKFKVRSKVQPIPRCLHSFIPTNQPTKLILFGGYNSKYKELNDLWIFNTLSRTWRKLSKNGNNNSNNNILGNHNDKPKERKEHSFAYFPSLKCFLLYGGDVKNESKMGSNEVWCLSNKGSNRESDIGKGFSNKLSFLKPMEWRKLVPRTRTPSYRYCHTSVVRRSIHGEFLYVFGGYPCIQDSNLYKFSPIEKTWEVVKDNGDIPTGRYSHSSIVTNDQRKIFVCFGCVDGNKCCSDIYSFNFESCKWSFVQIANQNGSPSARAGHSCVIDNSDKCLYIYGGYNSRKKLFNGSVIYELNLNTLFWKKIRLNHSGISKSFFRCGHKMVNITQNGFRGNDSNAKVLNFLMFGGYNERGNVNSSIYKVIVKKSSKEVEERSSQDIKERQSRKLCLVNHKGRVIKLWTNSLHSVSSFRKSIVDLLGVNGGDTKYLKLQVLWRKKLVDLRKFKTMESLKRRKKIELFASIKVPKICLKFRKRNSKVKLIKSCDPEIRRKRKSMFEKNRLVRRFSENNKKVSRKGVIRRKSNRKNLVYVSSIEKKKEKKNGKGRSKGRSKSVKKRREKKILLRNRNYAKKRLRRPKSIPKNMKFLRIDDHFNVKKVKRRKSYNRKRNSNKIVRKIKKKKKSKRFSCLIDFKDQGGRYRLKSTFECSTLFQFKKKIFNILNGQEGKRLKSGDYIVEYYDKEFKEYVLLYDYNYIPRSVKILVKKKLNKFIL